LKLVKEDLTTNHYDPGSRAIDVVDKTFTEAADR
jgi:hypothetical protein